MGVYAHIFVEGVFVFRYHSFVAARSLAQSMTTDCIRILLVEEENLVRAALRMLLESWTGFEVIGEGGTHGEALPLIPRLNPDIILLSVPNQHYADLQAIHDLARGSEHSRLLVLAGEYDQEFRIQVVREGAWGVIGKNRNPSELQKAIEKVAKGEEIWLDRPSLASLVVQLWTSSGVARNNGGHSRMTLLSRREREVVALVIEGYKNKEVGEKLFISETTVRHHLTTIFQKLKVSSRFELIADLHAHRVATGMRPTRNSRRSGRDAKT